jgi:hypothetical protein
MSSIVYDQSELVSRCSAMFNLMSVAERNAFLRANGLLRSVDLAKDMGASNHLILSPVQDNAKGRNRAGEALRLISDGKAAGPRDPNEKGVRLTDADMQQWFDQVDTAKTGFISREAFCELYEGQQWFGGPSRIGWVRKELDILCGSTTAISFEKFAFLLSHLSPL